MPSSPSAAPPRAPVFAVLLAGGRGSRLHELTANDCKPVVPFAGARLVDFTLTNAARSGVSQVLVATQYLPQGLARHLHTVWRNGFAGGLQIRDGNRLRPGGYRGTADAVRANLGEIAASGADEILVLSADHVYRMDYGAMIAAHRASGAMATVAADEVPLAQATGFGVLTAAADGGITDFAEKPLHPRHAPDDPARALVSMGIYVMNRRWLEAMLGQAGLDDFGQHILPAAVAQGVARVHRPALAAARPFYWRDVGTLDSYRLAQLDFVDPAAAPVAPPFAAGQPAEEARRAAEEGSVLLPGARLGVRARVRRTILAPGTILPDGFVVGEDAEEDRRWFRIASGGTVLVTPAMLARRQSERRGRFFCVSSPPSVAREV